MYSAIAILGHAGDGEGHDHMWGGGACGWIWGALMMALVTAAVGAFVVWVARRGAQSATPRPPDLTHEA